MDTEFPRAGEELKKGEGRAKDESYENSTGWG